MHERHNGMAYVRGTPKASVKLAELPATFTICSVTRRAQVQNSTKGYILTAGTVTSNVAEFFHGHAGNGTSGLLSYNLTTYPPWGDPLVNSYEWLILCGSNKQIADDKLVLGTKQFGINDVIKKIFAPASESTPPQSFGFNPTGSAGSDWDALEVSIFNRWLTSDEMVTVAKSLARNIATGGCAVIVSPGDEWAGHTLSSAPTLFLGAQHLEFYKIRRANVVQEDGVGGVAVRFEAGADGSSASVCLCVCVCVCVRWFVYDCVLGCAV
jgi:hypothetical protein